MASTGNPTSWNAGFLGDNWDEDPDEEWWKVQLTQGYRYTVELRTKTDWDEEHQATELKVLGIHDQAGTMVAGTASSRSGKGVSVVFQPDATGLYYIAVGSDGDDRTGVYRIRATEEEVASGSRQGRSADQDQQGSGGGDKSGSDKSGEKDEKTEEQNSPATGGPAITGTVRVGETLTADTSGISDSDGLDGAESATSGWPEASTSKAPPEPATP